MEEVTMNVSSGAGGHKEDKYERVDDPIVDVVFEEDSPSSLLRRRELPRGDRAHGGKGADDAAALAAPAAARNEESIRVFIHDHHTEKGDVEDRTEETSDNNNNTDNEHNFQDDSPPTYSLPSSDADGRFDYGPDVSGDDERIDDKEEEEHPDDDNDDEEEEYSSSSGSAPAVRGLLARGFRQATWHLERNRGVLVSELWLDQFPENDSDTEDYEEAGTDDDDEDDLNASQNRRESFHRFVQELGNGSCDIRRITFNLLDWHGLPEVDLRCLFGTVLPTHRTLQSIQIYGYDNGSCALPKWTKLLARSIHNLGHTSPLTHLDLSQGPFPRDVVQEIVRMIQRDPPLTDFHWLDVEADDVKELCQAVSCNTNLRKLFIQVREVADNALDGALGPSSPLRDLHVRSIGDFSDDAVAHIALRMRTNVTLESLRLSTFLSSQPDRIAADADDDNFRPLLHALEAHNFTLLHLSAESVDWRDRWSTQEAVTKCLARNRRIQHALAKFAISPPAGKQPTATAAEASVVPKEYRVEPPGLWPLVLEVTSDVATPMYRLLRWGALKVVLERGKKRGRAVDDVEGNDQDNELDQDEVERCAQPTMVPTTLDTE